MAGIKDIPFDAARQVAEGVRSASAARRSCVRIAIEVDEGAPSALVCAIRDAFVPQTSTGLLHVAAFDAGATVRVNPDCNAAIVVSGTSGAAPSVAGAFCSAGVPAAIVVESSVEVPASALPEGVEVIAGATEATLLQKLAEWLAQACRADVALGANFPFVRRAVCRRCVRARSSQNAVIGFLPFGSGADLPLMTANQMLMGLDVAGANGQGATPERFAETAVILAGAYASRAAARRLSCSLPGLGALVRAGVAYSATFALGEAARLRFELPNAWNHRK